MSRLTRYCIVALAGLCITALATSTLYAQTNSSGQGAQVSGHRILVLPFQIHADEQLNYLEESLPQLVSDQLKARGFTVVPMASVFTLLSETGIRTLDANSVRNLAKAANAAFAVFGSFSQVGETISIDSRLIQASGNDPGKPVFVTSAGLINLLPAVQDLASKIAMEVNLISPPKADAAGAVASLNREKIAEIDVKGTATLDKEVVLSRLTIRPGDVYDPLQIDGEIKRVFDSGYFDDIIVDTVDTPEGKIVTFSVVEKPRIQVIGVEGASNIDADDILAALSSKAGGVLNQKLLADDLAKVRELYRRDGYYLAKVSSKVEPGADPNQARLTIVVDEGAKLYIQKITINGASEIDPSDLEGELALKERGLFSFITGTGVLREEMLEHDVAAIEAYYANRGFIEIKVTHPDVEFKEDGIYITFNVVEGRRYKVGEVTYSGELLDTAENLEKVTKMDELAREGGYFDRSVLRDDSQALVDDYSTRGYAYAECDYDLDVKQEELLVNVKYIMTKNEKVYIRRVIVEGNDRTRDNVILREMRLGDGEMFDGSKLKRSNERLVKLEYFETVEIEPTPTADPSEMDLKVKVKEKPTGALTGGVGYSGFGGAFMGLKVKEDNLFGKGYRGGISALLGVYRDEYEIGITNPHWDDSDLGVGMDLYMRRDEILDDYDKDTVGGRVRFTYPVGEFSTFYAAYSLNRYNIRDVEWDAGKTIQDMAGKHLASQITLAMARDTTNRRFNPSEGSTNQITLDVAGNYLGGNVAFIRPVYTGNYFLSLPWDTVFHVRGEAGWAFKNGSRDVEPFEKFYLGGIDSIRGYKTISPADPKGSDSWCGGDKELFANFEYIFPLNSEIGMLGLVFFDVGNTWEEDDWGFDLVSSVGVGIRWYSPLGPLRLEYGYPLNSLDHQGSKGKFEFTIGQTF